LPEAGFLAAAFAAGFAAGFAAFLGAAFCAFDGFAVFFENRSFKPMLQLLLAIFGQGDYITL
jgi:hypothetical protein